MRENVVRSRRSTPTSACSIARCATARSAAGSPLPLASAIEIPICPSGNGMKSQASPPTDSAVSERPTT
jgi:hypothetical protein